MRMATVSEGDLLGLPVMWVRTPFADAALSLHGGQLLSYTPHGFDDLLWLSPVSRRAPVAIRGGVPVCWPYFGREGRAEDAPQHGFARNGTWILEKETHGVDGEFTIELSLPAHADTPLRLDQTLVPLPRLVSVMIFPSGRFCERSASGSSTWKSSNSAQPPARPSELKAKSA